MPEPIEQVQRAFTAYRIERELGTGGMATVYLAHDKKHDRKVAIKILYAELAAVLGAERFLHEIKLTASLQHPHILGLIDSGTIGDGAGDVRGRPYYVMPYVEGESVRQRLDKEQQLPVSDAVRIATDVASALDYAHRHGVIHRDIKPENILLHDGSAIVADFGIALAITQAAGARITQTGLSLGTPSYMSPEQAMGERAITARSDIYSLGVVTYEMLCGEPPFTGPTVQAVVARVMTEQPRPLVSQRRSVPPHVEAAVSKTLQKLPADRFSSAHEFAEALNNPSFALPASSGGQKQKGVTRRERRALYGVALLASLFLGTTLWGWIRPSGSKRVVRYSLGLDSTETMVQGGAWSGRLAISPDGSRLAYIGGPNGQLLVRQRNQLHPIAIPGSEGANTPFFSPDGQRVGFVVPGKGLQVVAVDGGPPVLVTDSRIVGSGGESWGADGFIYADAAVDGGLVRVEAKPGAVVKWFTVLDKASGEIDHTQPDVLPNGRGLLLTVESSGKNAVTSSTTAKIVGSSATSFTVAVAEIPSGRHHAIVNDAMYARYAASGQLLYVTTNGTLMTAPFDQNSMKITGEPTALAEGVRHGIGGSSDLAVSDDGTLVYAIGARGNELVWVTRDGKAQSVDPEWQGGDFLHPALSPDGKQLAVTRIRSGQPIDIWIKRLDRGSSTRLTLDGRDNYRPTWTPDGRSVTFTSDAAKGDLVTKRADGSAQEVVHLHEKVDLYNGRWSPDGKWLVFQTDVSSPGSSDILGIRPGVDSAPLPLVATRFSEVAPALSANGRWLAYASDESGQYEVYVVPFPNTSAARWAVSTFGGTEPLWSHDGSELFYRDGSGNLVAAEVKTTPTFSVGRSTPLFPAGGFVSDNSSLDYAVAPDDRRFLMIRPLATGTPDKLIVVENWFEELKAKSRK